MMPLLTAQKHQWTSQPPYNFYHFPEDHREGWSAFWESMDGDTDKVLDFAKKAGIEFPEEWFESLHKFLFDAYAGNPKLLRQSADKSFGGFLSDVAKNHQDNPKDKSWYTKRGVTKKQFIAMLERSAEISDPRQSVAYVNARVRDLGFYLYSEYMLSKTKGKSKIKSVASDLNKQAYEIECNVAGESLLQNIKEGQPVRHAMYPDEPFLVTEAVQDSSGKLKMLVVRGASGNISFIKDLWNVSVE
jgi:hypothetical protein